MGDGGQRCVGHCAEGGSGSGRLRRTRSLFVRSSVGAQNRRLTGGRFLTRPYTALRAALAVTASLIGIALLARLGGDRLSLPPLDPAGAREWLLDRGPVVAAFAFVRAAGLTAGCWTVGIIVARAPAVAADAPSAVGVVDCLTPAPLRRWLGATGASLAGVAGIGLAAPLPASATATAPSAAVATMHLLADGETVPAATSTTTT